MFRAAYQLLVVCIIWSVGLTANGAPKPIDIAVISDGESAWANQVVRMLKEDLAGFSGSDFAFRFPAAEQRNSQWSVTQAHKEIDEALANSRIEIVIAMGVMSSQAASGKKPGKPLIATAIIDARAQGFPVNEAGASGIRNLHYLASDIDLIQELKRFQEATGAEHIGLLVDATVADAISAVGRSIKGAKSSLNFKVTPILVRGHDMEAVANKFPPEIDALFVLPLSRLSNAQRQTLIEAITARSLPSFTTLGRKEVETGYLMGTSLIPSPEQLARQLAVDIRDIALGRPAGSLPVSLPVKDRLFLNLGAARAIDYEPPFTLLAESEVINALSEEGRVLTLSSAVDESLNRNLSVAVGAQELSSAKDDTRIARSSLLPQLSARLNADAFDRDLVGMGATRSTSATLALSQSIYSESKWSNYTSRQYYEQAQAATLESTRLNVIQETAQAYLQILVTRTKRDIQRDNVKLTRANLERAQFRYEVGSSDRSEVLRFETELGSALQSLSNAQNSYRQAKNVLNQILHRPIEEPYQLREPGLSDPRIFGDKRLESFIKSPKRVGIFRDFLAKQSLENSPEIESLRHQIAAQERMLLAVGRKRYVPDVDLTASIDRTLDDYGAQIPADHDNDWRVGVQLSLPLYQGSRIFAEKNQARTELRRLQLLYKQQEDSIETKARNSVAQAGASRQNIGFARDSAVAAEKTLELVTSAYVRGTASYIDLIDAQNALLNARLSASIAEYQHLIDLIALQRAIGFFDFHVAAEQEDNWFNALDDFAKNYGTKQ